MRCWKLEHHLKCRCVIFISAASSATLLLGLTTALLIIQERIGDYRDAVVAIVAMITVLLFGALVYAATEDLLFLDALYFAVATATTVGFGDYVPNSDLGKVRWTRSYAATVVWSLFCSAVQFPI